MPAQRQPLPALLAGPCRSCLACQFVLQCHPFTGTPPLGLPWLALPQQRVQDCESDPSLPECRV